MNTEIENLNRQPVAVHRLRVGDVILLEGEKHFCEMVNDSRARCVPMHVQSVSYTTTGGKAVTFNTFARSSNISPDAEVEILEQLGEQGMKEFFASKVARRGSTEQSGDTKENNMAKSKTAAAKKPTDGYPSNEYDRFMWECLEAGGTKEQITAKIVKHWTDAPGLSAPTREYRTNPKNAEKWLGEAVTDMTAAGKTAKLLPSTAKAAPDDKTAAKTPNPPKAGKTAKAGGKTAAKPAALAAPVPTVA